MRWYVAKYMQIFTNLMIRHFEHHLKPAEVVLFLPNDGFLQRKVLKIGQKSAQSLFLDGDNADFLSNICVISSVFKG